MPPATNEWGELVVKIGTLTLVAGTLEMAIIAMVCRIVGKAEEEISGENYKSNWWWCEKFKETALTSWLEEERADLVSRLSEIRKLYHRRNRTIHAALGIVGDSSISGVPAGSVVDLRTYGVEVTSSEGNTWTIGIVGQRVHLHEIDRLIEEIHTARLGLVPFMELCDKIQHPGTRLDRLTANTCDRIVPTEPKPDDAR
jgi:hypothetical protein